MTREGNNMILTNESGLVVTDVNGVGLHLPKRDENFEKVKNGIKNYSTEELQELHILIASEIVERTVA